MTRFFPLLLQYMALEETAACDRNIMYKYKLQKNCLLIISSFRLWQTLQCVQCLSHADHQFNSFLMNICTFVLSGFHWGSLWSGRLGSLDQIHWIHRHPGCRRRSNCDQPQSHLQGRGGEGLQLSAAESQSNWHRHRISESVGRRLGLGAVINKYLEHLDGTWSPHQIRMSWIKWQFCAINKDNLIVWKWQLVGKI